MYKIINRAHTGFGKILFLLLLLLTSLGHAQQGSQGNTFVSGGIQMTFFGAHSFVAGGGGVQPGIIKTARTAPLGVLGYANAASYTGSNDANHIDGYVSKSGTSAFVFPVGNGSKIRTVGISAPSATATFKAAYWFSNPNTANLPAGGPFFVTNLGTGVTAVSTKEYWDLDGPSAVNVTLAWDAASDLNTLAAATIANLAIVGYNTTTSKWEKLGTATTTTGTLAATGSITATGVIPDTYSAFTFGVAAAVPDLTPTIDIDNQNFASGQSRDFAVYLFEGKGNATSGTVTFRIARQSGWDITVPGITLSSIDQSGIAGTSVVGGGTPNENDKWLFRQNTGFVIVTLKSGNTISGNGMTTIGFKAALKAGTSAKTVQSLSVTVVDGSGGETDFTNNLYITNITAN